MSIGCSKNTCNIIAQAWWRLCKCSLGLLGLLLGICSLICTDYVTHECSSGITSEVYKNIQSAKNVRNNTTKDFIRGRKWKVLDRPSHSADLNPKLSVFFFTSWRETTAKHTAQLNKALVQTWKSIRKEECVWFGEASGSPDAVITSKECETKYKVFITWIDFGLYTFARIRTISYPSVKVPFWCKYQETKVEILIYHLIFIVWSERQVTNKQIQSMIGQEKILIRCNLNLKTLRHPWALTTLLYWV